MSKTLGVTMKEPILKLHDRVKILKDINLEYRTKPKTVVSSELLVEKGTIAYVESVHTTSDSDGSLVKREYEFSVRRENTNFRDNLPFSLDEKENGALFEKDELPLEKLGWTYELKFQGVDWYYFTKGKQEISFSDLGKIHFDGWANHIQCFDEVFYVALGDTMKQLGIWTKLV